MNNTIESENYHTLIMNIINGFIKDIHNTSITPTSDVIDVLLDIRNLTSVWDSEQTTTKEA